MATTAFQQELPPPGGYQRIVYEKVPLKPTWSWWKKGGIVLGIWIYSFRIYLDTRKDIKHRIIENRDSMFALAPLFLAERDRYFLKEIRLRRDEEEELMKDVPGWEVGTLYGEKIYTTLDPDEWYSINSKEFYVHSKFYDWYVPFNVPRQY